MLTTSDVENCDAAWVESFARKYCDDAANRVNFMGLLVSFLDVLA